MNEKHLMRRDKMSNYYKRRNIAPRRDKVACDDCVCNAVKNIANVQDEAAEDCSLGCGAFIQQLKSGGNEMDNRHTTIPCMLCCGGACDAARRHGVVRPPKGRDR